MALVLRDGGFVMYPGRTFKCVKASGPDPLRPPQVRGKGPLVCSGGSTMLRMFVDLAVRVLWCLPRGHHYRANVRQEYLTWTCLRCTYTTSRSPGAGWFRKVTR